MLSTPHDEAAIEFTTFRLSLKGGSARFHGAPNTHRTEFTPWEECSLWMDGLDSEGNGGM
jgi:hypothetical protein